MEPGPPRLTLRRSFMRTIIAIKPCPQGQQPGERFDVPDEHAVALVLVGAATYADEDTRPRGRYRRRDLRAEDLSADLRA